MIFLAGRIVVCTIFSVHFLARADANSFPPSEYYPLSKTRIQSANEAGFQALKESTNRFERGYLLVRSIDSAKIAYVDRFVGRLDLLYTLRSKPVSSDVCTAAVFGNMLLTASHCIPGKGAAVAERFKFTRHYYFDGQSDDDRREFVLNSKDEDVERKLDATLVTLPVDIVKFKPTYREPIPGETVILVSHPLGEGKRLSIGNCRVKSLTPASPNRFEHSCTTMPGSSGAVVVAKSDLAILGVHVAGGLESGAAYSMVAILHRFPNLAKLFTKVPPPESIDTSGWPLTPSEFVAQLKAALRGPRTKAILKALTHDRAAPKNLLGDESLYMVSVEAGSIEALKFLDAEGISLPNDERRKAVDEAIDAIDHGLTDGALLERVLDDGGIVAANSAGVLPQCADHRLAVLNVLRARGYKSCL